MSLKEYNGLAGFSEEQFIVEITRRGIANKINGTLTIE